MFIRAGRIAAKGLSQMYFPATQLPLSVTLSILVSWLVPVISENEISTGEESDVPFSL